MTLDPFCLRVCVAVRPGPVRATKVQRNHRGHAFYAQDQIPLLGGRLRVNLSGRVQFFSLQQPASSGIPNNPYQGRIGTIDTPNAYTGDGSAAYFFASSQTKLRAHGGNRFRAPSSYERFGGGFGSYYGDPRLKPDRAVAVDGGIDQWVFQSKLQLSGTVFYTKLQEAIRFVNTLPADDRSIGPSAAMPTAAAAVLAASSSARTWRRPAGPPRRFRTPIRTPGPTPPPSAPTTSRCSIWRRTPSRSQPPNGSRRGSTQHSISSLEATI
jgi:hypothetical protein